MDKARMDFITDLEAGVHSAESDRTLRPSLLHEYIGQGELKESLGIFLQASLARNEALEHVLIAGPSGLGKTTLANIIAHEMKSKLHTIAGPNLEKKNELAALLANLEPRDVLFIDEVHRMPRQVEEILYSAMEDYRLDLVAGSGATQRTISIDVAPFTLVGATTRAGMLTQPLRDRFGLHYRLEFYPVEDLERILERSSGLLGLDVSVDAIHELARRARGTPRVANRLLRRLRDVSQVRWAREEWSRTIDLSLAREALQILKIDELGLDSTDRRYLQAIIQRFGGGPVGLSTLSSVVGEDAGTLEQLHEPFLIRQGLMQKTPRGRVAAPAAYRHFGVSAPGEGLRAS